MNKNLKKKEFVKSRKGITLIALVITIIVLLILAGISISMLAGDNSILNRAGQAREKNGTTGTKEQIQIAIMSALSNGNGQIKDDDLRTEIKKNISGVTDNDITGNERNGWQVKKDNKAFAISNTGNVNEAFWEEVKNINGDITEIRRIDGKVTGINIGDSIGYNALDGLSQNDYTITSLGTVTGMGEGNNQTIEIDAGSWRVLGVEKGRLKIIHASLVGVPATDSDNESSGVYASKYLKLSGQIGYENVEKELNRICSFYGKGKYADSSIKARSINIEDVNTITGYNPNAEGIRNPTENDIVSGNKYGKNTIYQYKNKITFSWNGIDDKPNYTSSTKSGKMKKEHHIGFFWYDGNLMKKTEYVEGKIGKICELTSELYGYVPTTLIDSDYGGYDVLFNKAKRGTADTEDYWLASKGFMGYSNYSFYNLFYKRRNI